MSELMRHLLQIPGIAIDVRTATPPSRFPSSPDLRVEPVAIDVPIQESSDALRIDGPATAALWEKSVQSNDSQVRSEAQLVSERNVRLIISDIPYLAGAIAEAAGVPAIGISNFTWNWILQPFLDPSTMAAVRNGYQGFTEFWQLPFGHQEGLDMFRHVAQVPLLAPKPTRSRASVRAQLGLRQDQPALLLCFRGNISEAAIARARLDASRYAFLDMGPTMQSHPDLSFSDLAGACDLLIGKLGYGLVAACVANQWRLLHIAREGFREDVITRAEAPRYTCLQEMPLADFAAGRWAAHLDTLLSAPMPASSLPATGARECTERILSHLKP